MGEPLHNIDNVIKAADIMVDEQGLHFSPRKVTVSTSGLVPQLRRFLHESNCALAVSLNATTDEVKLLFLYCYRHRNSHEKARTGIDGGLVTLNSNCQVRNWIMPINRKYKLDLLLETLREELCFKHNYKVLFEYVMLEGINDRLGKLLSLYCLCWIHNFTSFPNFYCHVATDEIMFQLRAAYYSNKTHKNVMS